MNIKHKTIKLLDNNTKKLKDQGLGKKFFYEKHNL